MLKEYVSIISSDPLCKNGLMSDSPRYPRNLYLNNNVEDIVDFSTNLIRQFCRKPPIENIQF